MIKTPKIRNLHIQQFLCFIFLFIFLSFPVTADNQTLIPNDYVQSFLKDYSPNEIKLVKDDLDNIRTLCFRSITAAEGQKTYVATAGGVGASKSTILEVYLHDKPNFAYLDPDQRALKFMINTYLQEFTNYKIRKASGMKLLLQGAYDKWRGGSNYIASTLINEASEKGYNIAHGTTSSSEHVAKLFEQLKKNNYKITLLLCSSTDQNREASLQYRVKDQCYCQVDPTDIIKKGKLFLERFPVYFQYADELRLYWVDDFLEGMVLAATLTKGTPMIVHDKDALQKIMEQYDNERKDKKTDSLKDLIRKFETQR